MLTLNPEPIGTGTTGYGSEYPRYPERSCFILPSTVTVEVEALHVECTCTEMVVERTDTSTGRCRLLDFARVHESSCGFPAAELVARLP